jgi:hypothetical protein
VRTIVVSTTVLLLLATPSARADAPAPDLALDYQVPAGEGCPDETAFRRLVALRLGYDPFVVSTEAAHAKRKLAVVVPRATEGRATVTLVDARTKATLGERKLNDPGAPCAELVSSAAFASSVAIDPAASLRPPPTEPPPPAPPPEPAPAPTPTASPRDDRTPPPPAPSTSPAIVPSFRLGAHGGIGVAPAPSFGLTLGASVRRLFYSAGIEGRFDLPAADERDAGVAAGARVTLRTSVIAGGANVCRHARARVVDLHGCVVAWAGAFRGESDGIPRRARETSPWFTVGPRLGAAIALFDQLDFDLRVDVPFAVTTIDLRVEDRVVWSTPTVSVLFGAGISWTSR